MFALTDEEVMAHCQKLRQLLCREVGRLPCCCKCDEWEACELHQAMFAAITAAEQVIWKAANPE